MDSRSGSAPLWTRFIGTRRLIQCQWLSVRSNTIRIWYQARLPPGASPFIIALDVVYKVLDTGPLRSIFLTSSEADKTVGAGGFAEDTSIHLKDGRQINMVAGELNRFGTVFGLLVNTTKSVIISLGPARSACYHPG